MFNFIKSLLFNFYGFINNIVLYFWILSESLATSYNYNGIYYFSITNFAYIELHPINPVTLSTHFFI